MSWLHHLPAWLQFVAVVGVFTGVALAGLFLTRPFMRRLRGTENELVGFVYAVVGVVYAVLLATLAVAAWEEYGAVEAAASHEAAAMQEVYLDARGFAPPVGARVQAHLRENADAVIDQEWPAQARGEPVSHTGTRAFGRIVRIFDELRDVAPATEGEKILLAEVVAKINSLLEYRRIRMVRGTEGLPATMWWVIWLGGFLTVAFTYLFFAENLPLHVLTTLLLSLAIGMVVFLIVSLDRPLLGAAGVSVEPFVSGRERMELMDR
ncbi:MAG: DUF4239 domain-containing protein [Candidatus Sericytochromatia bacterium]|nr:DUF4239 domain-containing protein [Candidatus Tanganyikabacteria bacterium]